MKTLSIHETKTHMSKLLHDVDKGIPIIFGARGQANYQIVKLKRTVDRSRAFGALKGKIIFSPDYEEADREILALFEESINKSE